MKLSKTFFTGFLLLSFCAPHIQAQTVNVYWNNANQVIDGFGASSANEDLTSTQAMFFFSASSGNLGLSLLRTEVPSDGSCITVNATCAGQVSDMQLAIADGARVWSTPWSPPASMKSNGSITCNSGSGSSSLNSSSYSAYANYLANYVKSLKNLYGIQLYALSIQNEPTTCPARGYGGAIWTAANFDTFIKTDLGPTFVADDLTETLIMMSETSNWAYLTSVASTTMGDPAAAAYVGIIAWHDYDDAASVINPFASQGKKYWETEVSGAAAGIGPSLCNGCWDPSIADALMWAQIVNDRVVVANANAWHYWVLISHGTSGVGDNAGLGLELPGSTSVTIAKRAYMLGNYSKFVRPGFYRIDATATPQSGVSVSAFKNATSGALVIVVINQNSSNVSQSFTLNGATASSVTPWITSTGLNLAQQTDVSVSGGSFTYSLPGHSITSFVGNTVVGHPTALTAKVQ
jgi:glucuronoarabinoxylan endo-1,4-beta-xylanase